MTLLDQPGAAGSSQRDDDRVGRALLLLADQGLLDGDPATRDRMRRWVERQPDQEVALGRLLRGAAGPFDQVAPPGLAAQAAVSTTDGLTTERGARPLAAADTALRPIGTPSALRPLRDPPVPSAALRQVRVATWVRNAGIIILLFIVYQWWGTAFQQHRSQAHLKREFAAIQTAGTVGARTAPLPGGVVARLQIPAIHLDQYVVEGTSDAQLRKGPGHYIGSAMPGQPGNAAIAGHRTTYGAPFYRLNELIPGDTIETTTAAGAYLYVVSGTLTVAPNQSSVVEDYGDNRLTLTTCTPEYSATHRLIVVARLEGLFSGTEPAKVAAPAPPTGQARSPRGPVTANLIRQAKAGFDWSASIPVILALGFLVGLGFLWRPARLRMPPLTTMVVLAPLWLGALLFLFEQLSRFLPPNV